MATSSFKGSEALQHRDRSPTSFMDLPQELRDLVYHELWKATPRLQVAKGRTNRGTFEVHYNTLAASGVLHYGLPQWLRCNKTFLREGIRQLLTLSTWNCHWFPLVQGQYSNSQLVDLSHVTSLTFVVHMTGSALSGRPSQIEFSLPPIRQHSFATISSMCPRLRNLTIQARHDLITTPVRRRNTVTWSVDLSRLEAPNCQLDSITICGTMWWRRILQTIAGGLQEAYETELARVGQLLVGLHGQIESEEAVYKGSEGQKAPPTHTHRLDFVVRICTKSV